jgi:dihydrofolate synthase/folylpolyglutamate synthase
MNFNQAVTFLYSRESKGWKLDLSRITALMAAIDNPHRRLQGIHIAGTNGKGSIAAMLESIFFYHGHRTGLYTSPHLYDPRERIRIDREMVEKKWFLHSVEKLRSLIIEVDATFFEAMTAIAFDVFATLKVEWVILETGLGGRFDATNIFKPIVSIISNIQFDHVQHLGNTIELIAFEKAGIIKPETPCVLGMVPLSALRVIEKRCAEQKSPLIQSRSWARICNVDLELSHSKFRVRRNDSDIEFTCNLVGIHQVQNARIALSAVEQLKPMGVKFQQRLINEGLKNIKWPGRFQVLARDPLVLFDVAHNPAGMKRLLHTLARTVTKPVIFILGLMGDKDARAILHLLRSVSEIHMVSLEYPRAMTIENMEQHALQFPELPIFIHKEKTEKVIQSMVNKNKDKVLCLAGSHHFAPIIQKAKIS